MSREKRIFTSSGYMTKEQYENYRLRCWSMRYTELLYKENRLKEELEQIRINKQLAKAEIKKYGGKIIVEV